MKQGYASNSAGIFTGVLPRIKQQGQTMTKDGKHRTIRRKFIGKPCSCGGQMNVLKTINKDGYWVDCPDCKSTGLIPRHRVQSKEVSNAK